MGPEQRCAAQLSDDEADDHDGKPDRAHGVERLRRRVNRPHASITADVTICAMTTNITVFATPKRGASVVTARSRKKPSIAAQSKGRV
jgi:hypothetical protein